MSPRKRKPTPKAARGVIAAPASPDTPEPGLVARAAMVRAVAALEAEVRASYDPRFAAYQHCHSGCETALAHLEALERQLQARGLACAPTAEETLVKAAIAQLLSALESLEALAPPLHSDDEAGAP